MAVQEGSEARNYAFNHFNTLYGPSNGLYGDIKKLAEGEGGLTGNKNENPESERMRKKNMRKEKER